jgi:hypothetical protein
MLKKSIGVFLVLIVISSPLMFIFWIFMPEKPLNILILDKTVIETKTQEHISLSWILTHDKYAHSKTGLYDYQRDYFGFFPNDSGSYRINDFNRFTDESLDSLARAYDMVYYTDLYGIFKAEWDEKYPKDSLSAQDSIDNSMERSGIIYGGMTAIEMLFLRKMKNLNKLIISEFNIIASPTDKEIRKEFETEFGLQWTGWVGRYYHSLDTIENTEIPRWMKRNYLAQHNNTWPFKNAGIVFVKNDDQVEILEDGTHLDIQVPIIYTTPEYRKKYGLPAKMKYSFWFDIIETSSKNKVVSNYKIHVNPTGQKLLSRYGIPQSFPAVVEHDSTDYRFYYFAGDYCDNPIGHKSAKLRGIYMFSDLSYKPGYDERVSFFWNFYRPMVRRIISDYTRQIKRNPTH